MSISSRSFAGLAEAFAIDKAFEAAALFGSAYEEDPLVGITCPWHCKQMEWV